MDENSAAEQTAETSAKSEPAKETTEEEVQGTEASQYPQAARDEISVYIHNEKENYYLWSSLEGESVPIVRYANLRDAANALTHNRKS